MEEGALSTVMSRSGLLCMLALPHKVRHAKNDIFYWSVGHCQPLCSKQREKKKGKKSCGRKSCMLQITSESPSIFKVQDQDLYFLIRTCSYKQTFSNSQKHSKSPHSIRCHVAKPMWISRNQCGYHLNSAGLCCRGGFLNQESTKINLWKLQQSERISLLGCTSLFMTHDSSQPLCPASPPHLLKKQLMVLMSWCVLHSYLLSVNKTLQGLCVFLALQQLSGTWGSGSWLLPRIVTAALGGSENSQARFQLSQAEPQAKLSFPSLFTLHIGTSLCWPCRAQQFSEHLRAKEISNLVLIKSTVKQVQVSNPAMSGLHLQCKHSERGLESPGNLWVAKKSYSHP